MKKRVLVAPIDWGLGHASRCIPLIEELLDRGVEVHLGGAGDSLLLLREYFPELLFHQLPSYSIRYSRKRNQVWKIFTQLPLILRAIRKEHQQLNKLIKENGFTAIISDNRYGLWNPNVYSVILCHQVQIPLKNSLFRKWAYRLHMIFLKRFDILWIPDFPGESSLAGSMSVQSSMLANHVGILSRFQKGGRVESGEKKYDVLGVLSGPEPQRSLLEEELMEVFTGLDQRVCLVLGKPGESTLKEEGNLRLIPHLPTETLKQLLLSAEYVISRSGYSSLMDYAALGLSNVGLIPTPGQPEQEYLANRMEEKGWVAQFRQGKLEWGEMRDRMEEANGFPTMKKLEVSLPADFWEKL